MLEEQIDPYIPSQRMQNLFLKLRPDLYTNIITYYKVPQQQDNLVLLATCLENSKKKASSSNSVNIASHKRYASELQSRGQIKKKRSSSPSRTALLPDRGRRDLSIVECYSCYNKDHYSRDCPKQGGLASTCKVGAASKQSKLRDRPKAEGPPAGE